MLSLAAPRNCVQKSGAKRRCAISWNCPWPLTASSRMLADVVEHRLEGFLEERLVDPEEHFLADLLRVEDARFAQQLQVMGDGRAGKRRDRGDLAHVEPLALLKREEDSLPMGIAQRGECPRDGPPFARDGAEVVAIHNHILSYIDTSREAPASRS